MPLPDDVYQELIRKREVEHRAAERDARHAFWRTIAMLAFWVGVGLFIIGLSWRTTDAGYGRIFWYGGMAVWLAGVFATLHLWVLRREARGD